MKRNAENWCCDDLRKNFTLTIDDQDIRELYHGSCPWCKREASIGKERPQGRVVSLEEMSKMAQMIWNA